MLLPSGVADGELVAEVDRTRAVQLARQRVARPVVFGAFELVKPPKHVRCRIEVAVHLQRKKYSVTNKRSQRGGKHTHNNETLFSLPCFFL